MEQMKEFLMALQNDPKAHELLSNRPTSANDEEAVKAYVELAGELGFELTAEQIVAEAANAAKELYARTEAAQSALEDLDQEDLAMVAGGREPDCTSAHVYNCHSTHERWADWCWFSDYCSSMINIYA